MTRAAIKLQKNLQSKAESIDLSSINWKKACFAGFFASLFLLIFYVWQVNALTHGSYTVNDFQKQIGRLSQENKNLQISFAENSFLGQAMEKTKSMNFQKATAVKYVQISDSALATTKK